MKLSPLAVLIAAALSSPLHALEDSAADPGAVPALQVAAGTVARADFTTEVVDREPVDSVDSLSTDVQRVAFFTELQDMEGQTVTHVWEYEGEIMAEVPFTVQGPRWRVWSSKNMMPEWTGEWTVSVINAEGELLDQDSFRYVEGTGAGSDRHATDGHDMGGHTMDGAMDHEDHGDHGTAEHPMSPAPMAH